jgi:hypothetical protein
MQIPREVENRELQGKETEVVLAGEQIPLRRVRKEMRRHKRPRDDQLYPQRKFHYRYLGLVWCIFKRPISAVYTLFTSRRG